MDEKADDFRRIGFEGGFEGSDGGVDVRHGEVVRKGAVAGYLDAFNFGALGWGDRFDTGFCAGDQGFEVFGGLGDGGRKAGDEDIVDVEDAGDGCGNAPEAKFDLPVAIESGGLLDGRGLTFDMGEDALDLGDVAADVGLELGDKIVGGAERHVLVDLEMLLEMKDAAVLLESDVVDGEVRAGGDGADAVVEALGFGGGGDGVDDDIGAREVELDGPSRGRGDLLGALKGEIAGHGEGDVGEEAGAGLADAQAVYREDPVDGGEGAKDVATGIGRGAIGVVGGGRIEEAVDGSTSKIERDAEDDAGDQKRGDGVGDFEGLDVEAFAEIGRGKAEDDRGRGPDVGGEVDGIGFEGEGVELTRGAMQGSSAGEVDRDGQEQDQKGPDGDG